MNSGMKKIQQMNRMKRELKERGVSVPRGTDYEKLKRLYKKESGASTAPACSLAGKALQSCSKSRAKRQTQQVLFGFTI